MNRWWIVVLSSVLVQEVLSTSVGVPAYGTAAPATVYNAATNQSWTCLSPYVTPMFLGISDCPKGYYCPLINATNNATFPQYCSPSPSCLLTRLNGGLCSSPQGVYDPVVCLPGYVCPDGYTMTKCPQGYYCPAGSTAPLSCLPGFYCPEGSSVDVFWGVIVFMIASDVFIFVCGFLFLRTFHNAFTPAANGTPLQRRTLASLYKLDSDLSSAPVEDLGSALDLAGRESDRIESVDVDEEASVAEPDPADVVNDAMPSADVELQNQQTSNSYVPNFQVHSFDATTSAGALRRAFELCHPRRATIEFEFENLGLTLGSGRKVLHNVSGTIPSGCVTAIMGGSGSGKSTLMNVLLGVNTPGTRQEGVLRLNGIEQSDLGAFRHLFGLVPQDDLMHRSLTVFENILYSARCRLPMSVFNDEQVVEHVRHVIAALRLNEVANSVIGDDVIRGISGGQRKRASIGMELCACPLAFFLDEPTSGLDSTTSLELVSTLSAVARECGICVIMVVHQPRVEIWRAIDHLVLLHKGELAYVGHRNKVESYFARELGVDTKGRIHSNPADTIIDALDALGTEATKKWTPSIFTKTNKAIGSFRRVFTVISGQTAARAAWGASFSRQVGLVFVRTLLLMARAYGKLIKEVVLAVFVAVIVGYAFRGQAGEFLGDNLGAMLLSSSAQGYSRVVTLSLVVCVAIAFMCVDGTSLLAVDRPVWWREVSRGHSALAFFVGVNLASLLRLILIGGHFAAVYHVLAEHSLPFTSWIVPLLFLYQAAIGLAQAISTLMEHAEASIVCVGVSVIMASFNGLVGAWPLWLCYLMPTWWFGQLFLQGSMRNYCDVWNCDAAAAHFRYDVAGIDSPSLSYMVAIGLTYRAIAFVLMMWTRQER